MVYVVILLALGGLFHTARLFLGETGQGAHLAGAALAFGFLLLASFCAARVAHAIRLPHVVAYLLTGIVAGPYVLGLVDGQVVETLKVVNGVAVALIALSAGTEMSLERMRPLLRTVAWMTVLAGVGGLLVLGAAVLALSPWLPFLDARDGWLAVCVAALVGVALSARSPAVLIALLDETRADGPVSRTMLGVVVSADLLVVILYALLSTAASSMIASSEGRGLLETAGALGLSIAVGLAVALVFGVWLSRVRDDIALFALLICVVVSEVGQRLGLDTMVVMLTAGVALRNVAPHQSQALVEMLGKASLPVYLLFFSVAGATLHLDVLATLAVPATILVGIRAATFWAACKVGGRLARSEATVARWTWTGLLPQAGLALALALLIERSFPTFGRDAAALCFAVVAINEMVMPVLLRIGIGASGEAGSRAEPAASTSG